MGKRRKKRHEIKEISTELNIMPFIDIFSMLNTFLLISAAFVNLGLIEVQIPFLTNAPPDKDKPQRTLDIHVAVTKAEIELQTKWTAAPVDEKTVTYKNDPADLKRLHKDLVALRTAHPESDTINFHSEDDVQYRSLVKVLDEIMYRQQGDPQIELKDPTATAKNLDYIYRKVIMADVIL